MQQSRETFFFFFLGRKKKMAEWLEPKLRVNIKGCNAGEGEHAATEEEEWVHVITRHSATSAC